VVAESKTSVFKGFNPFSINADAVANAVSGDWTSGDHISDVIDMTTDPDDYPAKPDNRLKINFDAPKTWNGTVYAPGGFGGGNLPVTLRLDNQQPGGVLISVYISDVTALTSAFAPVAYTPPAIAGGPSDVAAKLENGVVTVVVAGLPPGNVYDKTTLALDDPESLNIAALSTAAASGSVHTFLSYEIRRVSGAYFALVRPYKGYPGVYTLIQENAPAVEYQSDGTEDFLMPVYARDMSINTYQIVFSPAKSAEGAMNAIYSQKIRFQAGRETTVSAPRYFEIVDSALASDADGDTASLLLDLRWDIGDVSLIDNALDDFSPLKIEYALNLALNPNEQTPERFAAVTLEIRRDAGEYFVKYSDPDGKVINVEEEELTTGQLKNRFVAKVKIRAPACAKDAEGLPPGAVYDFVYPNIYFLNVEPLRQTGSSGEWIDAPPGKSLYASVTLDAIADVAPPPPQNVTLGGRVTLSVDEGDPKDETSFNANWTIPGLATLNYLENSADIWNDVNIKTTLYISQDESYLRREFTDLAYDAENGVFERQNAAITVPMPAAGRLYFSPIDGDGVNIDWDDALYDTPRDALRDGKVIALEAWLTDEQTLAIIDRAESVPFKRALDGMDKNQKYFVCADIFVERSNGLDPSDASYLRLAEESPMSPIAGITTAGKKEPHDPAEKEPPSPEGLDKKDVGLDSATIFWKIPNSGTDQLAFEIIRLESKRMDKKYFDLRDPFWEFWVGKLPDEAKAGVRISDNDFYMFDGAAWAAGDDAFRLESDDNFIYIRDDALKPNHIYFYYVRTVRLIPAGGEKYSVWSETSVTTLPSKAPENLRVDERREYSESEIYITFDAPVSPGNLAPDGSFYLQYQLKEDASPWGEHVTMTNLTASETDKADYTRYVYKITGLKPGAGYRVRVRVTDVFGGVSLYTNIAAFRTEANAALAEKNRKKGDWTAFLRETLNSLHKTAFWTWQYGGSVSLRRPHAPRASQRDFVMRSPENAARDVTYYIPASDFPSNGFVISRGGTEILLAANFWDFDENAIWVKKQFDRQRAADCFIKIDVLWQSTQSADIAIALITTNETAADLDDAIAEQTAEKTEAMVERYADKISEMVDRGFDNEALTRFVHGVMDDTRDEIATIARHVFEDAIEESKNGTRFDGYIVARTIPEHSVKAFSRSRDGWTQLPVMDFDDEKAARITRPGFYALEQTPVTVNAKSDIRSLIAKYGLDDVVGYVPDALLTRDAAAACVAEVGGENPEDPFEWLRSKGADITPRERFKPVTAREALLCLMTLYELKTGVSFENIRLTAKSAHVTGKHAQSARAALELGFYEGDDIDAAVTIGEFFEMLATLEKR
jgi:hypothetical protein